MCRMIAAVGKFDGAAIVHAAFAMSRGLTATHEFATSSPSNPSQGVRHLDGWGAVYRDGNNQLECIRSALALSCDQVHPRLNALRGGLLVMHVRAASVKSKTGIAYVHPIEGVVRGDRAYFFHNGYAPDLFRYLGRSSSFWDSKELFEWLLPALASDDREAALREQLERLPATTTCANFMLVEPARLTVCNWFTEPSRAPRYFTIHVATTQQALIISSEPVFDLVPRAEWWAMTNKTISSVTTSF